jgi:hypothetical protein
MLLDTSNCGRPAPFLHQCFTQIAPCNSLVRARRQLCQSFAYLAPLQQH